MAEINQSQASGVRDRIRCKKLSTKIDMTPMVDLAFLLLTFFILTTTLNKLKVLDIPIPEKTGERAPINEKRVLSLILDEGNRIYWRRGISSPKLEIISSSSEYIRQLLIDKNKEIDKMLVQIKSTNKAKYKMLVDVIDELQIAKIDRYCFDDLTKDEVVLVNQFKNVSVTSK